MIRFAILYFIMLVLFLVLIIGPVIVRNYISGLPTIPLDLMQPTGQDNNDTTSSQTGSALIGGGGAAASAAATTGFNFGSGF